VSRWGYYEWATPAPSDRELSDAWLIEKIKQRAPSTRPSARPRGTSFRQPVSGDKRATRGPLSTPARKTLEAFDFAFQASVPRNAVLHLELADLARAIERALKRFEPAPTQLPGQLSMPGA
jgi:hypothetical protein